MFHAVHKATSLVTRHQTKTANLKIDLTNYRRATTSNKIAENPIVNASTLMVVAKSGCR